MNTHVSTHPNSQLRQERIKRNWRQRDLADQLGTTVVTVNRWERGIQEPNAYFRVKLCALFGKSAEELGIIPTNIQPLHIFEDPMPEKQLIVSTSPEEALVSSVSYSRNSSEELLMLWNTSLHSQRPIHWNIPFVRNSFFIGRAYELEHLYTQLHQHHIASVGQTQAISGLGGIGKTQLVIEYAYRYYQEYQSVLWVRANSAEALNSSYTELATLLNLPEKEVEEQEIVVRAVKIWLETHSEWLLILDNLDESEETLFPPDRDGKPRRPSPFLPMASSGHLLITARATDLSAVGLGIAHPLHLETFPDDQGVHLLLHRAGLLDQATLQDREVALSITQELGGLALALDQAGAYIAATRIGLDTYLHLFQKHQADLLKQRRNRDYPESVATTWTISFQRVEFRNPVATELLSLCAFFAPDAVPEEIFTEGADNHIFSAISLNNLAELYSVQGKNSAAEQFYQQALTLSKQLCGVDHPYTALCLNNLAGFFVRQGKFTEAEPLYRQALTIREEKLEPVHPDIAQSLNNLATIFMNQGKYREAEPLLERTQAIFEYQFGKQHFYTALSLNNLAEFYRLQGKFTRAETLYQRVLALYVRQLGGEHSYTVLWRDILARFFESQRKFIGGEPLLLSPQMLIIREMQWGPIIETRIRALTTWLCFT